MKLAISGRKVSSPFGLMGKDENALSFALGYTFQQCPELLWRFLREIGVSGVRRSSLDSVEIDLQRHSSDGKEGGITDIEIRLPGAFHVIIEAKIRFAVPALAQCQKYLRRLDAEKEPQQKLVAMVQSPNDSFAAEYAATDPKLGDRLRSFHWAQFLGLCVRLLGSDAVSDPSKDWLHRFLAFLNQEYPMRAFSDEVMILPISTGIEWEGGMSFWEIHQKYQVYFRGIYSLDWPLYLAFRVNGTVDAIYRVTQVEHSASITERVPELLESGLDWIDRPHTIWTFGEETKLPRPLTTGKGMYQRTVKSDLDLLLTCATVAEIEKAMKERREG